jgi:hypothetical protein
VILGSESHRTHDHNTKHYQLLVKVKVKVTLRLAVYRQSVLLVAKPLETHDQRILFKLNPRGYSLYATSYLARRWVCHEYAWFLSNVRITHTHVTENSSFCIIYKSSVSTDFAKQIMPILHILLYNGSLVTWKVASLTTAKFMPLVFSVSDFALFYTVNMFILMILYDFCLLPAQFESHVQIADRCAPCFVGPEILSGRCLLLIPRRDKHKSLLIWSVPYGGLV